MKGETSPFAAIESEFQRLARRPDMRVAAEWLGCSTAVSIVAVRDGLLRPFVDYEIRDRVLRHLGARACDDERWMVALIGVLLPGLRRAVHPLAAYCPDLAADVESEALAGLMRAFRKMPPDASHVAAGLVNAACYRATRLVAAELAVRARCEPIPEVAVGTEDSDSLLAAAVLEGAISKAEAEMIAETRLGGVPLGEYAAEHGLTDDAAQKRRAKGEAKLRDWLLDRGSPQNLPTAPQNLPAEMGS